MRPAISIAVVAVFLMAAAPLAAQYSEDPAQAGAGGGFVGPGPGLDTVAQALSRRDDAFVTLRGNIVRHLGSDKYLFQDQTGTITVDIDQKRWGGQKVTPEDVVEISGEVDKDWTNTEIDVDSIKVI
jgi:uncharacterized protein (TIGR00156 family)